MQANFHPGPDVITIPRGTFTLTRKGGDDQDVLGDLDVTDSVTLDGAGSARTVIDGNGTVTKDRVLEIFPTATVTTVRGLTLRGGLRTATFDAIVLATGYRAGIAALFPASAVPVDASGLPTQLVGTGALAGVYFVGFDLRQAGGLLRTIGQQALAVAARIGAGPAGPGTP